MRMHIAWMAAALLAPQVPVHAQGGNAPSSYKVDFSFRENGATEKAVRHYTLLVEPNRKQVFKAGSRVPTISGSFQPGAGALVNTQYTYLDVGVNIECSVSEANGKILMHGNLDLSGVAPTDSANRGSSANPSLVQTRLDLETSLEPGKPTVIASIDDPTTSRQMTVEATVTRVN